MIYVALKASQLGLRLGTDSWSADESDDANSASREKNTDLLRHMKLVNGVLDMLLW